MNISSSNTQGTSKPIAVMFIALAAIMVIYSVINISIIGPVQVSLHSLTAQAGDSKVRSEALSPLPVPTPPAAHSQVVATPAPALAAQSELSPVPQPVPTPPLRVP